MLLYSSALRCIFSYIKDEQYVFVVDNDPSARNGLARAAITRRY
jgi:hypothetical protein